MICVSLAEESLDDSLSALRETDFAEIRLDRMTLTPTEVGRLFSAHPKLIATCRPGPFPDDHRRDLLLAAIDAGAAYVDVEVDSEKTYRDAILTRARTRGCRVIVSFHDYERTPDRAVLEAVLSECFEKGADIAKIACKVESVKENARLLGLLDAEGKVVVVAMGGLGRIIRVVAPLLGSPFTFASLRPGKETADGQIDRATLERLIGRLAAEGIGEKSKEVGL
jgi:3-dehydroquinate dehydratase I